MKTNCPTQTHVVNLAVIKQSSDGNNEPARRNDERYGSLLLIAACYCLIAFLCGGASFQFAPYSFLATVIFLALSTASVVVAAAFAMLGEGPYWKRLCFSQLICGSVGACFLFGALIFSPGDAQASSQLPFILLGQLQLCLVSSLGAQFPFGLMRVLRHWQLHHHKFRRSAPFSISDLMVFTVFVSVVMGICNWNAEANTSPDSISSDWIQYVGVPLTAFGLASRLFGIPILALVNHTKDVETGCLIQFGVVAAVLFVLLLPMMAIGSPATLLLSFIGVVTGIVVFISLPFCAAKTEGFVLTKAPLDDETPP